MSTDTLVHVCSTTVYCDFVPTVGDVDSARDSPCWFREKDSHEEVEWIKGANPDEDSREG